MNYIQGLRFEGSLEKAILTVLQCSKASTPRTTYPRTVLVSEEGPWLRLWLDNVRTMNPHAPIQTIPPHSPFPFPFLFPFPSPISRFSSTFPVLMPNNYKLLEVCNCAEDVLTMFVHIAQITERSIGYRRTSNNNDELTNTQEHV